MEAFLLWGSLFYNGNSFCQVDIKPDSTTSPAWCYWELVQLLGNTTHLVLRSEGTVHPQLLPSSLWFPGHSFAALCGALLRSTMTDTASSNTQKQSPVHWTLPDCEPKSTSFFTGWLLHVFITVMGALNYSVVVRTPICRWRRQPRME